MPHEEYAETAQKMSQIMQSRWERIEVLIDKMQGAMAAEDMNEPWHIKESICEPSVVVHEHNT
jgi:hypothetical protein